MKPVLILSILSFWALEPALGQHFISSIGTKPEALQTVFPDTADVHLTLAALKVDKEILEHFRSNNNLSRVSKLVLYDVSIGKKELTELTELLQQSLVSITFFNTKPDFVESERFEFPKLEELVVYNTTVPKNVRTIFSRSTCPALRSLVIEECRLTPLRIRELATWDLLGQIRSFVLSGDIEGTNKDNVALLLVQNLNIQSIEKIVLNRMAFELSSTKQYNERFPALYGEIETKAGINWSQFRALQHVELSFSTEDTAGLMKLLSDSTLRSLPVFIPPYPVIEFDFAFPTFKYNIEDWQTSYKTLSQFYDSYFSVPLTSSIYRFPLTNLLTADRFLKSIHAEKATEVTLAGNIWHYHAIVNFLNATQMPKLKTIRLESSSLSQREIHLLTEQYPDLNFNVSFWPGTGSKYWPTLSQQ